jgi:hypothetical protein
MARRALLTDGERESLRDPDDHRNPYVAVSRVRRKINEELVDDVRLLEEHRADLLEELREAVCHEATGRPGGTTPVPETPAVDGVEETGASSTAGLSMPDLEGSGSRVEERKAALRAIVEHLEEHEAATAARLKDIADRYDHGYDDADGFWANMRRQDVFDALPVETPGRGGREYRYADADE